MRPSDDPRTTPIQRVHLDAHASGPARINQAGRDQHFHYADGVRQRQRAVPGQVVRECPYPGLAAFGPEQADWFFGRDRLVAELTTRLDDRLRTGGMQLVVASSGAGKSSLLRAGLLPALDRGALPGSDRWPKVVLTPTADPLWVLAANLALLAGGDVVTAVGQLATEPHRCMRMLSEVLGRSGPDARVVVVVDQFEELFTLCTDDRQRRAFIDLLGQLAEAGLGLVVVGVRADFYAACVDHPRLLATLQDNPLVVGPMSDSELREAILFPARAVGLDIEPGLVEVLLRDLGNGDAGYEAGRLPLLAHALRVSWQQRHGTTLTVQGYRDTGGIQHAIATTAEQVYRGLDGTGQALARSLFLRLVRIGDGAQDVRRHVSRTDLLATSPDPDAAAFVVAAFTRARLLTQQLDTVEITHEALLHGWPRLRDWIGTDRDWLRARQRLADDTEAWQRANRDPFLLYRGTRLAVALQWLPEHANDLTATERQYLDRARARRKGQTRRRRALFTGFGIVILVAAVFGSLFVYARKESDERAALANSRSLAQTARDSSTYDPGLAVMTAMAAYHSSPTLEARNQLLQEYLSHSRSTRVLSGLSGRVGTFHTSRDGEVAFARVDLSHAMLFVHAATGQVRRQPVLAGHYLLYPMVTPDGKRVGFVDEDGTAGWFDVHPDDTEPAGPVHQLPRVNGLAKYYNDPEHAAAMSADGKLIAVATGDRLVWWDLDKGTIAGSVPAPANASNGLWFAPDNRTLLLTTFDSTAIGLVAVDMVTGRTRTVVAPEKDLDFVISGDRTTAVVCRPQGVGRSVLRRVRVSDGAELGRPYDSERSLCADSMATDVSGRRVAVYEYYLTVVDLDTGVKVPSRTRVPLDHTRLTDLISAGEKLLLASNTATQITYTELPARGQPLSVVREVLTHDGSRTISLLTDGSLQVRRTWAEDDEALARSPAPSPRWKPHTGQGIQLNRDEDLIATREGANVVAVRDAATLRQTARITTAMPSPRNVEDARAEHRRPHGYLDYWFDRTGNLLTVANTQVQQWDTRTGRQLAHWDAGTLLPPDDPVNPGAGRLSVAGYPAPNQVAVIIRGDPVIRIVDLASGRTTATMRTVSDALTVHFEPTGRHFALVRQSLILELWQRDPPRRELGPLYSLPEYTTSPWYLGFRGGNGNYVLAANNSIRIYRIGVRAAVDSYEFGRPNGSTASNPYSFIDVSRDGRTVIYADERGTISPLALDPGEWQRDLCRIIGYRAFTPDERASLPAPIPTHQVCPPPG